MIPPLRLHGNTTAWQPITDFRNSRAGQNLRYGAISRYRLGRR